MQLIIQILKTPIFRKCLYLPNCIKMVITSLVFFFETCTIVLSIDRAIYPYQNLEKL